MKSLNEFPTKQEYQDYLRVYFAAMAMKGLLSHPDIETDSMDVAEVSVNHADALINTLNQKEG